MKTQYRLYFWALLMVFASANAYAQDPFYSQIFANRLQLSPALAGSQESAAIMTQYRAQWINIPGSYRQWGLAYDQPIKAAGKGWNGGITLNLDQAGETLTMSQAHLHIAKEFDLGAYHRLRIGLAGGLQSRSIDFYRLRFPDQIDPRQGFVAPTPPTESERFTQADFHSGLAYYNRYFYVVGTIKHLQGDWLRGDSTQLFRNLPRLYSLSSGFRIPIIKELEGLGSLSLNPAIHYQRQGDFDFYMLGLALETQYIQLMTWWQPGERISGGLGCTIGPVQLAYQYDRYLTNLFGTIGPSHEISLAIRLGDRKKGERSAMPIPAY
ncbi:MAG: PorP/SprF family type IX secretion system membrane protein [Bacteroidota bacterium]